MNEREAIVAKAVSQIGYKEKGNNDTIYGAWYGMNYQPWCMMFISWCAAQCGISTSTIPKLAYVPYCMDFYQKQGRYKAKGTYRPEAGDLILYGSNSHIGIVEKVQGNTVFTIEGNTSANGNSSNGDGVYRRSRALSDSWIKGYCLPDYKEEEEVEIKEVKIKSLDTGNLIGVKSVNIQGENYIRLRDMEEIFPVKVDWDGKNPTINLSYK